MYITSCCNFIIYSIRLKFASEDSIRDEHSIAPVVYTPQWAAPEVMQPIMLKEIQPPFQPPSDVYSLTMVLYECLTQKVPFGDQDQFAQIGYINRST